MNTIRKAETYFASFWGKKWSAVTNARTAIARAHREFKWGPTPFGHPDMSDFWTGLRKCCDNTQRGQNALRPDTVRSITRRWMQLGTLDAVRNAFVAVVQTWGVKRISDVLRLHREHISLRGDGGYTLYIAQSKNDAIREGLKVALPATAHDGFNVSRVVSRFLTMTRGLPSGTPLLRSTDNGAWASSRFSSDAWNKALRKALAAEGFSEAQLTRLSSHSLRKGGYTALIRGGVAGDCAQRIIGHKSSRSAKPYMCRPLADLAAASRLI